MCGEERSEEKIRRRKRGSGMAKGQKIKIKPKIKHVEHDIVINIYMP
jgi:hypothetical protein